MYKLYKNNKFVGATINPTYVIQTDNGYILTTADNAQYLVFEDKVYNILGLSHDEDKETIMILEFDGAEFAYKQKCDIDTLILTNIM